MAPVPAWVLGAKFSLLSSPLLKLQSLSYLEYELILGCPPDAGTQPMNGAELMIWALPMLAFQDWKPVFNSGQFGC